MCEYCEGDNFIFNDRKYNKRTETYNGFEILLEDNELDIYACLDKAGIFTASGSIKVEINYCPMCGRKLDV